MRLSAFQLERIGVVLDHGAIVHPKDIVRLVAMAHKLLEIEAVHYEWDFAGSRPWSRAFDAMIAIGKVLNDD